MLIEKKKKKKEKENKNKNKKTKLGVYYIHREKKRNALFYKMEYRWIEESHSPGNETVEVGSA